ncbi:MAG: flagellar protein FlaG [Syntrophomonadaceae bacterium]|nr:flagellar protein FlaG [Syntrophomonadaceae bacterium]
MTSINGVDPIVVDTIKVQTQKPAIVETKKTKIDHDKKNRDKNKDNYQNKKEYPQHGLPAAIDKLNKLLEENKIPLYFQILDENPDIVILLINAETKESITQVPPEKIFKLVSAFSTKGFTLDELI